MLCPRCQKKLDKAIFYNTEIDYCPFCLGIFFEEDELGQAKDVKDKNLAWLDVDLWQDEKKFKISYDQKLCPACRLPLYEISYGDSNVKVDLCNVCHGIWLDRGEFKKIIEYLKKKADYEILENYTKNLLKEFWEIFTGPESLREEILDFLTILKTLNYKFATQYPIITKIISQLPK
jgi:Zn-finger nucleic acid-binding protein